MCHRHLLLSSSRLFQYALIAIVIIPGAHLSLSLSPSLLPIPLLMSLLFLLKLSMSLMERVYASPGSYMHVAEEEEHE